MDKFKNALDQIRNLDCEMVDFKIVDANGRLHHVTIPTANLTEKKLEFGFGFDGSNFGFAETKKSDFIARPIIGESVQLDPCFEEPTATFMCEVWEAGVEIHPFAGDPRNVLKKALKLMQDMGVAKDALFGPELEYFIFDDIRLRTEPHALMAEIISDEGYWGDPEMDYSCATRIAYKSGYHVVPPKDTTYQQRVDAVLALQELGFKVKYHHHEVAGPSQQEIEFNLMPALQAADSITWGKYIVRNVAADYGMHASFMPKPIYGEAGSGLHVHHMLTGGKSEYPFSDPSGYMGLSKVALSFLAGILKHAPALAAITNPSTNSYKRLVRGHEAPCNVCYGMANRNAAVRIPAYATEPSEKRFEYRVMDATANPYLGIAAILMAGLDGIKKNLNPEGEYGPLEKMPEGWEPKTSVPATLKEALDELRKDRDFLLEADVFTKDQLDMFIRSKTADSVKMERQPHPVEFEMYDYL